MLNAQMVGEPWSYQGPGYLEMTMVLACVVAGLIAVLALVWTTHRGRLRRLAVRMSRMGIRAGTKSPNPSPGKGSGLEGAGTVARRRPPLPLPRDFIFWAKNSALAGSPTAPLYSCVQVAPASRPCWPLSRASQTWRFMSACASMALLSDWKPR